MAKKPTRSAERTAETRRISQIGDFKARLGGEQELPSGLIVKVKNPGGLRAFLGANTIPNSLMKIIQDSLKSGKAPESSSMLEKDGSMNPQMMDDMTQLMDIVAVATVVEPKIWPRLSQADVDAWNADPDNKGYEVEDPEELRRDDRLYADELPDDDKAFIFQWISGGTRDLEKFRQQQQSGVASLAE